MGVLCVGGIGRPPQPRPAQGIDHGPSGGKACLRLLGQRPQNNGLDRRREVGYVLARRRGLLVDVHQRQAERGLGVKGRAAGDNLVQDRAQGIDIGLRNGGARVDGYPV